MSKPEYIVSVKLVSVVYTCRRKMLLGSEIYKHYSLSSVPVRFVCVIIIMAILTRLVDIHNNSAKLGS